MSPRRGRLLSLSSVFIIILVVEGCGHVVEGLSGGQRVLTLSTAQASRSGASSTCPQPGCCAFGWARAGLDLCRLQLRILAKLDTRLADTLDRANTAPDNGTRNDEIERAKAILAEYLSFVRDEPLIDHVDGNPFGVATHVRKVITDSLTHMGKSIAAGGAL